MQRRKLGILILFVLLFTVKLTAQTTKYQVAYLYNFTNYIEWPTNYRSGNFVIGVLGANQAVENDLRGLAKSKKIQGQNIEVKVFNDIPLITQCHILVVPKKYISKVATIQSKLAGKSTLLVSDMPGSVSKGMAISFVLKNGKLNFQLDSKNAQKYGLKVSSSLEQLASR